MRRFVFPVLLALLAGCFVVGSFVLPLFRSHRRSGPPFVDVRHRIAEQTSKQQTTRMEGKKETTTTTNAMFQTFYYNWYGNVERDKAWFHWDQVKEKKKMSFCFV